MLVRNSCCCRFRHVDIVPSAAVPLLFLHSHAVRVHGRLLVKRFTYCVRYFRYLFSRVRTIVAPSISASHSTRDHIVGLTPSLFYAQAQQEHDGRRVVLH